MKTLRVLEAACGVVAGALGLATVVYTLSIMPAYAGISTVCNAPGQCVSTDLPSKTIAENQGVASLIPAILIFSLPFAAILAGRYGMRFGMSGAPACCSGRQPRFSRWESALPS